MFIRILSALFKAQQLDTHTASLMQCVFFIRSSSLEAITRVILDFNGEIMDLEEGGSEIDALRMGSGWGGGEEEKRRQ